MWAPIRSSGNIYEVHLSGFIRHVETKRTRKPYGGRTVNLGRAGGTKLVSRLVCEAFNGPAPEDKPHAAHADGDPLNNGAYNLYWATPTENEADKRIHGTWFSRYGGAKLTEEEVSEIKQRLRSGESQTVIAQDYAVTASNICAISNGRSWIGVP